MRLVEVDSPAWPVAVIGAGPVGLATAVHLVHRGLDAAIFEKGSRIGAAMEAWKHVRLFSPWSELIDPLCGELLHAEGWALPDLEAVPTAAEVIESYLEPLARLPALAGRIRLESSVVAVSRHQNDRLSDRGREVSPFVVRVRLADGTHDLLARAVIDASGTYSRPNHIGANGLPAHGEEELHERISYGIPDVQGRDRGHFSGQRVAVVGSGHSAMNALIGLAAIDPPQLIWARRRAYAYEPTTTDRLPARSALETKVDELVSSGRIDVRVIEIDSLEEMPEGIVISGGKMTIGPVDRAVAATGYRPDFDFLRELRLAVDPKLESSAGLAHLIDPNRHTCGTVPVHGAVELAHPEQDFFVVGMKSYGRAPTFLLKTGYAQVGSVADALAAPRLLLQPTPA
jgi:thioredoxin reductase